MKRHFMAVFGLMAVFLASAILYAQTDGPGSGDRERAGQEDRPRRGADGGRDRGEWMTRMNERMREQLGASEEEWQVLQPKVQKVMEAQRATRAGFGFGGRRGGPGGPGGPDDSGDTNPVAAATRDLRATLDNESASADEIQNKLTALREAREQAQEELQAAQSDLRSLLTQRQEATLVMTGILD